MPKNKKSKVASQKGAPELKPYDIVKYRDIYDNGDVGEEEIHVVLPEAYITRNDNKQFYQTLKLDGEECVHSTLLFNEGWEYSLEKLTSEYELVQNFYGGEVSCKLRKKRKSRSE